MLKIEKTEVVGWEAAIRGMRNPMNSWEKSDSGFGCDYSDQHFCSVCEDGHTKACPICFTQYKLGPNDLDLIMRLRAAGIDHRKFMRMIEVYVDITAPLYWWKEFDTYKVGTVANSCSTMHKIAAKEFTLEDFSCEHLMRGPLNNLYETIDILNICRWAYVNYEKNKNGEISISKEVRYLLDTMDKKDIWWQMIQLLPSSYNQRRTIMLNYEVLANMYKSRKGHRLDEWKTLLDWIKTLPYSDLITGCK